MGNGAWRTSWLVFYAAPCPPHHPPVAPRIKPLPIVGRASFLPGAVITPPPPPTPSVETHGPPPPPSLPPPPTTTTTYQVYFWSTGSGGSTSKTIDPLPPFDSSCGKLRHRTARRRSRSNSTTQGKSFFVCTSRHEVSNLKRVGRDIDSYIFERASAVESIVRFNTSMRIFCRSSGTPRPRGILRSRVIRRA